MADPTWRTWRAEDELLVLAHDAVNEVDAEPTYFVTLKVDWWRKVRRVVQRVADGRPSREA